MLRVEQQSVDNDAMSGLSIRALTQQKKLEQLLDYTGMSGACGIPERSLRTLAQQRKIPFLKLGHRTVLFEPSKVLAALARFEVVEVGRPRNRRASTE